MAKTASAQIIIFPGVRFEVLRKCEFCGREFRSDGATICPPCRQAAAPASPENSLP